ncbi:zf-HC2 domain-containing protein [Acidaminobacterium chupaoyuni]
MDLSCEIIRDLLPLYHDGVCSEESRQLVEDHLKNCPACRAELEKYSVDFKEKNIEEAELIAKTAKVWRKSKVAAFFKGALIISGLASAACIIAYTAIGSYVAADGTLVEPFGFIPLAWLFAFLAFLFGMGLLFTRAYLSFSRRKSKLSK